jgi:hypothetical protein
MKLSKTQNPTMAEDRERMKLIPYASAIGSIKYAILYTRPIVYLAMSLARGTIVIQEYITGQRSKLSLDALKRTKEMFLGYGGDKEFVVKGYVDASFNTDPDDSESQSGYTLKVGAIS